MPPQREIKFAIDVVMSATPASITLYRMAPVELKELKLQFQELLEKKIIGPDLIQETKEKVKMNRERLKVATDRQKSYADMRRKDI